MLIIGDIAGQFDALMRLVARAPEHKIILVGDLMDRGPRSREVIEWAMEMRDRVIALRGNHEHMMMDFLGDCKIYSPDAWLRNGGFSTCTSYGFSCQGSSVDIREARKFMKEHVPRSHIEFLESLPTFHSSPGLFVSHAPWMARAELGTIPEPRGFNELSTPSLELWNRAAPTPREGAFQVFGHCSQMGLKDFGYAMCLDDSWQEKLTGLVWPEREILQEPY